MLVLFMEYPTDLVIHVLPVEQLNVCWMVEREMSEFATLSREHEHRNCRGSLGHYSALCVLQTNRRLERYARFAYK